jgi:hypothetical protein
MDFDRQPEHPGKHPLINLLEKATDGYSRSSPVFCLLSKIEATHASAKKGKPLSCAGGWECEAQCEASSLRANNPAAT